jgi:hypothetical protein
MTGKGGIGRVGGKGGGGGVVLGLLLIPHISSRAGFRCN